MSAAAKRNYARVISADSHLMEPRDLWEKTLIPKFGDRAPRRMSEYKGEKGNFFNMVYRVYRLKDSPVETNEIQALQSAAGHDPAARVRFQDMAMLDAEVLHATTTSHIMHALDVPVVEAAASVFNDWSAEFCSHDPKRLIGVGAIPTFNIPWAVNEVKRIRQKGLRGAMITLGLPEDKYPPYRDPAYDPLWAAAQDLDMPITLHAIAGRVPDPIHFEPKDLGKLPGTYISLMFEMLPIVAGEFIFGGILDRFPKLKLVLGEFEVSWVPLYNFRLARIQTIMKSRGVTPLKMDAVDYMKTRVWHGMVNDPYAPQVRELAGVSQIMWGSDYPHGRSIGIEAQDVLPKIFEGVPPDEQERIIGGNVAHVYSI
ncbi:MAG: amidohydrolase family protein [Lautropia sp.]